MEPIAIPVVDEGFSLQGALHGPAHGPGLVVCHPHPAFGGSMDAPVVVALAEAAAAAGLRTLRFDFRGVGGSGGEPTGGHDEHHDVQAALAFLRDRTGQPVALCGYSFGALMAARAIARGAHATRLAVVALPTGVVHGHDDRVADMRAAFAAQPTLFVAGTADPLCNLGELRAWGEGAPAVTVEELPGVGHFPAGPDLADLCTRVVRFLAAPVPSGTG